MPRPRLGKAERAIVREWHHQRREKTQAIVSANLDAPKPERVRYSSVSNYKASMTAGLYRGLYDPLYSTDKDTGRGLKPRKATVKKPWYVSKDKGKTI